MTKVKKCSQCGKEVPQGGTFCPFCGNIINGNGEVEISSGFVIRNIRGFIKYGRTPLMIW